MKQWGFFDLEKRLRKIDQNGDPLVKINQLTDWEIFRPALNKARGERRHHAGAKGYDVVLLFKTLILQSLYGLSDDATEFQILDRHSFGRFLGIEVGDKVPDATTIRLFRENLKTAGIMDELFSTFDAALNAQGLRAMKGQIVDASIVSAPKQRNTREENEQIKAGEVPDWPTNKRRRKDTDARWTKKNGKSYFGYKNHIAIDVKHKVIRAYQVTDAAVHDSQVFEELLTDNTSRDVWADSAYRSAEKLERLEVLGYREHIQRKGNRGRALTPRERSGNRTRSRIRSRVEHIFGVQAQRARSLLVRTVGMARARVKIGLRNLAYNIDRIATLLMGQRDGQNLTAKRSKFITLFFEMAI
jgi:IS5 family transposase